MKKILFFGMLGMSSAVLAASCLVDPVRLSPNVVVSPFGKTRAIKEHNFIPAVHWGTDFRALANGQKLEVLAVDNGVVVGSGWYGQGFGNRVALKRENGDIVTYSHLSKVAPELKGAGFGTDRQLSARLSVPAGVVLGVAGGTSSEGAKEFVPHLHLEYMTGFGGDRLREVSGGSIETHSRYLRNPETYLCRAPARGKDAGPAVAQQAGAQPPDKAQAIEALATQPAVNDRERWGAPDAPPYATYAGMSESQIVDAETTRRSLDTEWETKLVGMGTRGLWMEITRMRGVKLWLEQRIQEKHECQEAMIASLLAFQTNQYFEPRLSASLSRVNALAALQKVK